MKVERFTLRAVLSVLMTGLTFAATAQDAPPPADTPDQAAVRAAANAFADLLSDADFAKAKAAFAGSEADLKLAQQVHAAVQVRARFIAAVTKAIPESAKERQSDDLTIQGMKKRVARNDVKVTGDTATIGVDWSLKKVDGVWKVADIVVHPSAKDVMSTMIPKMTETMLALIPDIEAGKFKTVREIEQAAQAKMNPAAATRAATRPVK